MVRKGGGSIDSLEDILAQCQILILPRFAKIAKQVKEHKSDGKKTVDYILNAIEYEVNKHEEIIKKREQKGGKKAQGNLIKSTDCDSLLAVETMKKYISICSDMGKDSSKVMECVKDLFRPYQNDKADPNEPYIYYIYKSDQSDEQKVLVLVSLK